MRESSVVYFPLCGRRDIVEETARRLSGLAGEPANHYWRETARRLLGDLVSEGRSDAEARAEVRGFFEAVQARLCEGFAPALNSVPA